jgi:UDP-glucose:(heptosyl)LPS alpha-1,3-glucosyltransferase
MKIAFIRQRFAAFGGAERYMNLLIQQLSQRGHEIFVLANKWDENAISANVTWRPVPMIRATSFLRALTFAKKSHKAVQAGNYDLVISLDRTIQQDIYRSADGCHREFFSRRMEYASLSKRIRLRLNPLHYALLWLEKKMYSAANTRAVIALSHRVKEEIVRHYNFPAERIHVIHNGVDLDRFKFREPRKDDGKFVLLFVGSGFERKGLQFCIQALAKLPMNVELHVVGKGSVGAYQRLAEKIGVGQRVVFRGPIQNVELIYPEADVLIHPAIYEPFGNVVLEAMACGIPVVAARFVGASEIIIAGKNGTDVQEPADAGEFAHGIGSLLDRQNLSAMAVPCRKTAEAHSISRYVDQVQEVIASLNRSV